MCHLSEVSADAHPHHIQNALNGLYSRFKTLSVGSSFQDKFEMVESKLGSLALVDHATSVIVAVDEKLESAIAGVEYLKGVPTTLKKKCSDAKRQVSKAELKKVVEALVVSLGTRMYLSENPTVKEGTRSFKKAVRFCKKFSLARAKLSSFEYLEATAYLTRVNRGNCSVGVPEVVLDKIFTAMFGVSPAKQLFVRMCDGSTKIVGVRRTQTVRCLKSEIKARAGIPLDEQCLLYNGRELCDKSRLSDECNVQDSGTVHVMLRVAGGMRIKVKTENDNYMEIDVDPSDTVESMMRQLQQKSANSDGCLLELCLGEKLSAWDLVTQLAAMINQRSPKLFESARLWHAADCRVADPNFGEFSGVAACLQHYSTIASALDDVTVSISRVEEPTSNTVKVWWTMAAVMVAPVLGIEPTGNRFKIGGVSTHVISNGCIESSDWSWDAVGFMAQVGRPPARTSPQNSQGSIPVKNDSDYDSNGSSGFGTSPPSHSASLADQFSPELCMPTDDFDILDLDLLEGSDLFKLPACHDMPVKQEQALGDIAPESALALVPADTKVSLKRDTPAHGDVVCLQYLEYECGYCNVRKVSTSTGGDGRVRIRCECGGKHSDGQPRMHAKWKLCREVSRRDQMLALDKPTVSFDELDQPWNKRARTEDFNF
eukprot:TRINITY_DN311_c0_g1_i1.p1 TRINITY_DN311_c0_g1~~TRINITY_DN311_c0_g1_i1.p1  ORF type:complete len:656 (+),score=113.20 TRINITY_DN311_c0_g1_i1:115-2082(+)